MASELHKWGDAQQYEAEPHSNYQGPDRGVMPSVKVMSMNADPLGAIAAMNAMYTGKVVRSLDDVTDADRRKALEDVQQTHLKAPLEAVKIHMLVEGVDRAFTHQQVRQRTAVFAQESLRFAVPGNLTEATSLPPSLHPTRFLEAEDPRAGQDFDYEPKPWEGQPIGVYTEDQERWRQIWFNVLDVIDAGYHTLVGTGMPAEEARGLLPHATATRDHWITDLRNLSDHAGNRLCTQAQFHWRLVFADVLRAIVDYGKELGGEHEWQFEAMTQSGLFRPVCYQLGHCPFRASFDRDCSIRERVDHLAESGIPSSQWETDDVGHLKIDRREWLMDPSAARRTIGDEQ